VADSTGDLAVWNTAVYDYTFLAADTLYFWTVLAAAYDADYHGVQSVKSYGRQLIDYAIDCRADCAYGRAGDVNSSNETPPDEVTLGDIMLLVDVKFISGDCAKLNCVMEADVNLDGGSSPTCEDHVTLGDIMMLVDHLFMSGAELPCVLM
jgi:hypothetical protein